MKKTYKCNLVPRSRIKLAACCRYNNSFSKSIPARTLGFSVFNFSFVKNHRIGVPGKHGIIFDILSEPIDNDEDAMAVGAEFAIIISNEHNRFLNKFYDATKF